MKTEEWSKSYNLINNQSSKRMVFRFGADAGFFSEFNNMVLAILYCLQNNIEFRLYSKESKFGYFDNWTDFFLPFCNAENGSYHKKYNVRPYQTISRYRKFIAEAYKMLNGDDYLTQDLWEKYRSLNFTKQKFKIPAIQIFDEDLLNSTRNIISNIWHYNDKSASEIEEIKSSISMPDDYISIHIRSGDKLLESSLYSIDSYMKVAEQYNSSKNAFILTDDYTIIEALRSKYRNWNFFTLCQPSEKGYFHKNFMNKAGKVKYKEHLKLFASIDICSASTKFIGTYSSNIGMYIGMRVGESHCICLDYERWLIW